MLQIWGPAVSTCPPDLMARLCIGPMGGHRAGTWLTDTSGGQMLSEEQLFGREKCGVLVESFNFGVYKVYFLPFTNS